MALLSVVIPVRDGAETRPRVLATVAAQEGEAEVVVVVVDNGSRDATAAIAEAVGSRVLRRPGEMVPVRRAMPASPPATWPGTRRGPRAL